MPFDPTAWTHTGDPAADAVMARIQADRAVAQVDPLLLLMVRDAAPVPAGLPDYLRDFLVAESSPHTPEEAEAVARAERFYGEHGLAITMLLGFASLPWTYSLRDGASVLTRTGQLTRNVHRRVLETCQFVVDAFAGGGLGPDGRGLRDAQKIRLMHAAVRSYVTQDGTWDVAQRGVPACQTDLVATLCSFTSVVIDGLEKMGVPVAPEDAEAWLTAWRVLGRNLGIQEAAMPGDLAEARAAATAIAALRAGPNPDGEQLVEALSGFLASLAPFGLLAHLVPSQIRFFLGDERGDWLGLPRADLSLYTIEGINELDALLHRAEDRSPLFEKAGAVLGHQLVRGLLAAERGGTRPPFAIPPSLTQAWGV